MKPSYVSPIMEKVARRLGVTIHIEPKYGYVGQVLLPDGRTRYFRNTNFDLNLLGASEIARDKGYATYFLKHMGYPIPVGDAFFTTRWCKAIGSRRTPLMAYRYARRLGFPVIVKPNSKSQGSGVAKVWNKREFLQAVRALEKGERVFLVEKIAPGNDYRIVVLDGRIISAYQRIPLSVVGDGRSTITALLRRKQLEFKHVGRDTVLKPADVRISRTLTHLGLTRRSVLPKGERVFLLANANLSTGGDAVDVTHELHAGWRKLTKRLARDMNLRYVGIDVMVEGTLSEAPGRYGVLEVNAAPGLDNYAAMGKQQERLVEDMYEDVLRAMLR